MIKVSVFYPHTSGGRFDIRYYCEKHMPLVIRLVGAACKGMNVEQGIAGSTPGAPPTYLAMGHLLFESVEAFEGAFGSHAQEIMSDIPNYTNSQPVIQISEVKL